MSPSLPDRLRAALHPGRLAQRMFPDRLGIALFPDRLVFTRTGGAVRRRLKHKETLEFAPAAPGVAIWQPALEALARSLAAGALAHAEVTLVVSNHFVRYVLVPASELLGGREEGEAFARHCFERVYGAASDGWALKLSESDPKRARLACAIERSLVDALAHCLAALDGRYRSLQPHLMAGFNRVRTGLGTLPAWLVVAEPGLVCIARLHDGQWQSVSALKVGGDWLQQLPGLIAREECLVDCDSACERVLVLAPDAAGETMPQSGERRFEALLPAPIPGIAGELEASHGIALGA